MTWILERLGVTGL